MRQTATGRDPVYEDGRIAGRHEAQAEIKRLRRALRVIASLTGSGALHEIACAALREEEER